jgi:small subunit ribosomal protein S3
MSHKVHPKSFRLRNTADWFSRWFQKDGYAEALREDYLIRNYLEKKLKETGFEEIEIERFSGKITVFISTARPGLIIGRGGSGIEELRKEMVKIISKEKKSRPQEKQEGAKSEIRLEIREIKNPWDSASLTAQWVVQQLERRMPYRRVMKQAITKVMMGKEVQGIKVEVAGRLGGADIARKETLKKGRLPLQTMRAKIDYSAKEAKTTYGMVGVKVWFYKGEKFD